MAGSQNGQQDGRALLMKHAEGFGLPSVSPGCIQVEAYLRMAGTPFVVNSMKTTGTSPTGCLPAVEMPHGLGGHVERGSRDDLEAAQSSLDFIKQDTDLDKRLPSAAAAECTAFCCLVDGRLCDAVRYSMWCEWASLAQLPDLYGGTLPWPLNYFIPYSQAVAAKRRYKGHDPVQIYSRATACIAALNARCAASEGPYLLGRSPCSLDAKVYGLCAYIASADTVAPTLKDALQHAPALQKYLERIADKHFGSEAPLMKDVDGVGAWSAAANGETGPERKTLTAEEKKQRRRSWWWLGGAGALLVAYVVLGGDYVSFGFMEEEEEDERGGEGPPGGMIGSIEVPVGGGAGDGDGEA